MARITAAQRAEQESAQEQESASALDIAAAVATEEIEKAQRVYTDVTPRVLTESGPMVCVQREVRVGGKLGEYVLAHIRINPRDKTESAQRVSIAAVQEAITALAPHATLFTLPA
jgi:hypothetical protein